MAKNGKEILKDLYTKDYVFTDEKGNAFDEELI